MKKVILSAGVALLSLVVLSMVGIKLINYHIKEVEKFSRNVSKDISYEYVVEEAEKLYFVNVSVSEAFTSEGEWYEPSVNIESSIHSKWVSCYINYFPKKTTGENTCWTRTLHFGYGFGVWPNLSPDAN